MNVVYLHGFASGPGSTKAQLFRARLAARGVALEIPDLAPDFTHMTITSQLAIVDAILDRAPALVCGSSLGGYLAALAAAHRPERVTALLLIAPAFGFADRWEARVGAATMAAWRRSGTAPVFHYGSNREEPLSIALLDDARRYPDEPDPPQPTIVLHGRRDETVPLDAAERFVARRPAQRRLVVYESGHELLDVLEPLWADASAFLFAHANG
jgi:pimeloyl-ACP methyl ester carboxylesterase